MLCQILGFYEYGGYHIYTDNYFATVIPFNFKNIQIPGCRWNVILNGSIKITQAGARVENWGVLLNPL